MDVVIRRLRRDEIGALMELRDQMLVELTGGKQSVEFWTNTRNYLETHFDDGTMVCYVAEVDGRLVSNVVLSIYEYLPRLINPAGRTGYINNVFTVPEHRGKGLSEQLMRATMDEARRLGVYELYLHAEKAAISLYKRVGFDMTTLDMMAYIGPDTPHAGG